jgi:putative PIG3 family NAD(P)H quinone oxidoreductase
MRAIAYEGAGGAEIIRLRDMPAPEPGSDDALVAVAYAGLNRADILERMGFYPSPLGQGATPGLEFSGVVRAIGSNVKTVRPGDRVFGLVPGGAHAEILIANALTLAPVPDGLSLESAAALPEAFMTAYDALFARGGFALGQSVLIHAAGSSVGLAATALAKRAGGTTLGTSRTPEKLRRAAAHGLDVAIPLDDAWTSQVLDATGGRGVDLVLDFIGAPILEKNVAVLCSGGRIVQIGTLGGAKATVALGPFMQKRATLVGTVLRSRPLDERIAMTRAFATRLVPLFASGELRAEIDRTFPIEQMADAHRRMEANENFGKIVLEVNAQL